MKKKIVTLLCGALVATSFTGCGIYQQIAADEDGNVSFGSYYLMTDEEMKEFSQQAAESGGSDTDISGMVAGTKDIDGVTYTMVGQVADAIPKDELAQYDKEYSNGFSYSLISEGYFGTGYTQQTQADNSEDMITFSEEDSAEIVGLMLPVVFEVTLPDEIYKCDELGKTNGKTVTWTINDASIKSDYVYAYTKEFAQDHKPTIKGVKDKKSYKKAVKVKVNELHGFKVTSIKVDGKDVAVKAKKATKIKISDKGKHTITATNDVGNTNTITFTIR